VLDRDAKDPRGRSEKAAGDVGGALTLVAQEERLEEPATEVLAAGRLRRAASNERVRHDLVDEAIDHAALSTNPAAAVSKAPPVAMVANASDSISPGPTSYARTSSTRRATSVKLQIPRS
jgi:hypothetical protein